MNKPITITREASLGDVLAQYYWIWVLRIGFIWLLYHLMMLLWAGFEGKHYVLEEYPWAGLGTLLGIVSLLLGAFHHWHNEYYEPRLIARLLNDPHIQTLAERYAWYYDEIGERYLGNFEGMNLAIAPRIYIPEGYWLEIGLAPEQKDWPLAKLPPLRKPYEYYFHDGTLMLTTRITLPYWEKTLPAPEQLLAEFQSLAEKVAYISHKLDEESAS